MDSLGLESIDLEIWKDNELDYELGDRKYGYEHILQIEIFVKQRERMIDFVKI